MTSRSARRQPASIELTRPGSGIRPQNGMRTELVMRVETSQDE